MHAIPKHWLQGTTTPPPSSSSSVAAAAAIALRLLPHSADHVLLLCCLSRSDHIAMIIELLGPIPRQIVLNSPHAATYFDRNGKAISPWCGRADSCSTMARSEHQRPKGQGISLNNEGLCRKQSHESILSCFLSFLVSHHHIHAPIFVNRKSAAHQAPEDVATSRRAHAEVQDGQGERQDDDRLYVAHAAL